MYTCRNYRQNSQGLTFCGSTSSTSAVLADLHHESGNFYRTAVIAVCGSPQEAKEFADKKNRELVERENSENLKNDQKS